MKNLHLKLMVAGAFLLSSHSAYAQEKAPEQAQPQSYTVAFKTVSGKYVTMVPNGGLAANASEVTQRQVFTVVDLNGGTLVDGDKVKIRLDQSVWREDKDNKLVHRVPLRGSKDEESTFKVRVKGKAIFLEAPSGHFVAIAPDGKKIETREKREEASLLEAVPAQPQAPAPPKQTN